MTRKPLPDFITFFSIVAFVIMAYFIAFTYFNPPPLPKQHLSKADSAAVNRMMSDLNEESDEETCLAKIEKARAGNDYISELDLSRKFTKGKC